MSKSFNILRKKMSSTARHRSELKAKKMLHEMRLKELRRLRLVTQEDLAGKLHVKQSYISKLERQSDMYISRLRSYVESIGGQLDITVCFPDSLVKINQFEDLKGKSFRGL